MKKLKFFIVVLLLCLGAPMAFTQMPQRVNPVPPRYVFVDSEWDCKDGYKFDTRTGRLWEIKAHWNPEKAKVIEFSGIDYPAESDSYDGRFTFRTLSTDGRTWIYIFDTKTGNFWTCPIKGYTFHLLTE